MKRRTNTLIGKTRRESNAIVQARFSFDLWLSVFIGGSILGCSGYTGPRSVANDDPAVKIPEMRKAVDRGDRSVEPQLVKDLDNDDAAVRFYAIEALARLNGGERLGYDWTQADRHARADAVAKWQKRIDPTEASQ